MHLILTLVNFLNKVLESSKSPILSSETVRVLKFFKWLNGQLEGKDFICLDRYTVADTTAFTCFEFAKWPKILIPDEFQNLKDYQQRLSERPSSKA